MADTPKSLSDVKALLEEAVQVVKDLEATSASMDKPTGDASSDEPAVDTPEEQDNPTPPTA